MTPYVDELIDYVMANSGKSRQQAIVFLNTYCRDNWQTHTPKEQ